MTEPTAERCADLTMRLRDLSKHLAAGGKPAIHIPVQRMDHDVLCADAANALLDLGADRARLQTAYDAQCAELESVKEKMVVVEANRDSLFEQQSEVVSDDTDPSVGMPWMRCSPGLPAYIATLKQQRDAARTEAELAKDLLRQLEAVVRRIAYDNIGWMDCVHIAKDALLTKPAQGEGAK